MKNLKIILSLLPLLVLSCFIYFSAIGFLSSTEKLENKSTPSLSNKPQGTCIITFHLLYVDAVAPDIIKICVNGTYSFTTTRDRFTLELPCDESTTICVWDGTVYGTITVTPDCSCEVTDYNIIIAGTGQSCHCDD